MRTPTPLLLANVATIAVACLQLSGPAFAQLPVVVHPEGSMGTPQEIASESELDAVDLRFYATCPLGTGNALIEGHEWTSEVLPDPVLPDTSRIYYSLDVQVSCMDLESGERSSHIDRWIHLFYQIIPASPDPAAATAALIGSVNDLVSSGGLPSVFADPLIRHLQGVLRDLEQGRTGIAQVRLWAFGIHVQALVWARVLNPSVGDALIAAAEEIRNSL